MSKKINISSKKDILSIFETFFGSIHCDPGRIYMYSKWISVIWFPHTTSSSHYTRYFDQTWCSFTVWVVLNIPQRASGYNKGHSSNQYIWGQQNKGVTENRVNRILIFNRSSHHRGGLSVLLIGYEKWRVIVKYFI